MGRYQSLAKETVDGFFDPITEWVDEGNGIRWCKMQNGYRLLHEIHTEIRDRLRNVSHPNTFSSRAIRDSNPVIKVRESGGVYGIQVGLYPDDNGVVGAVFYGGKWMDDSARYRRGRVDNHDDIDQMMGLPIGASSWLYSLCISIDKWMNKWVDEYSKTIRDQTLESINDAVSELNFLRSEINGARKKGESRKDTIFSSCFSALRGSGMKVHSFEKLSSEKKHRVYLLVHMGVVVYVGYTGAIWPTRIGGHTKKTFDDVYSFIVDGTRHDGLYVERKLIKFFNPKYNKEKESK